MRNVKICAIQAKYPNYLEHENEGVQHAVELLKLAGKENPDIICLPELYPFWESPELFATAKQLGCYVIAGTAQYIGGYEYNTVILIDRFGHSVGRQRKVHRAYSIEFHMGGDEFKVFETDFGKIGALICIDGWGFPEGFYALAKNGAEIIFNPAIIFRKKPQRRLACISKCMDYRIPIISVSNPKWAFKRKQIDNPLPPEGGGSLVIAPPAELVNENKLAEWMKRSVSAEEWIMQELGDEEDAIITQTLDLDVLKELRGLWDDCLGKTRLI